MLIKRSLILDSEVRLKKARFIPAQLDRELGDAPLKLTVEQKQRRYLHVLATANDAEGARTAVERIIAGNDLDSVNYLAKGTAAARPVCRIQLKDASSRLVGYASGFLIGPGVLMTNHHVFGKASDATNSLADFDYEVDVNDAERPPVHFRFLPGQLFYTSVALDYSVVAVAPKSVDGAGELANWGWHHLSGEPGKGDPGEYLTIIQHPAGEMKQICVRENKLLKYVGDMVWYMTDTLGGSSGSPAFNRFWQVVALHHSGIPRKDKQGHWLTKDGKVWDESMDESQVDWIANEGIRISSIVADLKLSMGNHPMVKAALSQTPPLPEMSPARAVDKQPAAGPLGVWVEQAGDSTSLVVPLRIPIGLVRKDLPASALPASAPDSDRVSKAPAEIGRAHV